MNAYSCHLQVQSLLNKVPYQKMVHQDVEFLLILMFEKFHKIVPY